MNQMEREHKPPERQKFTALSRNGMEPQFTSLRSNALTEHPSAQLHALTTPCLSVLRSTRKESRRPPMLLLRPLHSTLLISSSHGDKAMGQMRLSPLFPVPFEPLPSSWAHYGLVIGARLWCPGMGTAGDTPPRSTASRPRAALGRGLLGANGRLEGLCWREKTSLGRVLRGTWPPCTRAVLVKEGD